MTNKKALSEADICDRYVTPAITKAGWAANRWRREYFAMARAAAERNISITQNLGPALAEADERRIHQIITNLVNNAVRYSPQGASITVETGRTSNRQVFARVTDSGPGLTDDDLVHVFDRFYRGSAAHGTEGSGVGLAIAAELASAHRGALTAHNTAGGGGASFMLSLPRG